CGSRKAIVSTATRRCKRQAHLAKKGADMHENRRFAIVITHTGPRDRIVDMPWLETEYRIDESDWMVLSIDGWRALADADAAIWKALSRKLIIGCYIDLPQFVVVIGHP